MQEIPARYAHAVAERFRGELRTVFDHALETDAAPVVFCFEREDAFARDMLESYAPANVPIASAVVDGYTIAALTRKDARRLLAAPGHEGDLGVLAKIARELAVSPRPCVVFAGGQVLLTPLARRLIAV